MIMPTQSIKRWSDPLSELSSLKTKVGTIALLDKNLEFGACKDSQISKNTPVMRYEFKNKLVNRKPEWKSEIRTYIQDKKK